MKCYQLYGILYYFCNYHKIVFQMLVKAGARVESADKYVNLNELKMKHSN